MPLTHDALVAELAALLAPRRLVSELPEGRVTVQLEPGVLTSPLIAIPDCHLSDASEGDEFFDEDAENVARLESVLLAVRALKQKYADAFALQLGDWFDLWRADIHATERAAAYQRVLDLDAELSLPHIIGNHDAAFVNAVPSRRVNQHALFQLGAFLSGDVYAMHGHQADEAPANQEELDEFVVASATAIARFVPGVRMFEAFIDSDLDFADAAKAFVLRALGVTKGDPPPAARTPDPREGAPDPFAPWVVREHADVLARIVAQTAKLHGRPMPKLLVVGHSHNPCVAWSDAGGAPLVIVDAGACVFGRFNLLVAAGDRVTVFDVA